MTSTSTFGSRKQSIHIYVTGCFLREYSPDIFQRQHLPAVCAGAPSCSPEHLPSTRLHVHSVLQDVSSQHDDVGSRSRVVLYRKTSPITTFCALSSHSFLSFCLRRGFFVDVCVFPAVSTTKPRLILVCVLHHLVQSVVSYMSS